ncbi:MAG TPA: cysteine--tRNA ligase, partial [Spirochaetia bacterium]|nr:cysteine--tRNA ligase [Spirochaetia bacterium]
HHTNEIAQSEAATGKHPWVRYWLHGEFLVTDKQKMAKSSGNFFTLSSLLAMGFSASAFRYLCLTAHYRSQLAFSIDAMKSAEQSLKNLHSRITELKREKSCLSGGGDNYRREFLSMLNNDLNIPRCLAVLNNMLKDPDLGPADKLALVNDFDRVLGICITAENSEAVPPEITALAEQRFAARKNRNWELADELRSKITRSGYIMTDTKDGFRLDAVKT